MDRGLVGSRTSARRAILAGIVSVDGTVVTRPAHRIGDDAQVSVLAPAALPDAGARAQAAALAYVSRSALKLAGALDDLVTESLVTPVEGSTGWGLTEEQATDGRSSAGQSTSARIHVPVTGRRALDVGASTGGFTEVLLERGASQVVALDVGHGQLHPRIASNERVLNLEGCNARELSPQDLPWEPDLVVGDVSFVAWHVLLPALVAVAPNADFVLMVKPQFEVGRDRLPKDGIVRDPAEQRRAVDAVIESTRLHGLRLVAQAPSRLPGTHGNVEHFLWLRRDAG